MKKGCSLIIPIFFFCIVTLSGVEGVAQDIQFTMPYSAPLYFNPAFAGSAGMARVSGSYRNQWPNISGQFISTSVSYDQYIKAIHGGLGINYYHDGMSTIRNNRFSGIYSAHIPVFKNKWVIKPALEGAYGQNRIDWSQLTFTGIPMRNEEVISYPDFSSGIFVYSEKFYAGFALHHFNESETGILTTDVLSKQYTGHIGANINLGDSGKSFIVSPSIFYFQQEDYRGIVLSCAIQQGVIAGAIAYQNGDKIIASLGFRHKVLRMAYSYDITVSRLGIVSAGSHEITLSFLFNKKAKPEGFLAFDTAAF